LWMLRHKQHNSQAMKPLRTSSKIRLAILPLMAIAAVATGHFVAAVAPAILTICVFYAHFILRHKFKNIVAAPGGLYSVMSYNRGVAKYSVIKALSVDKMGVHIRHYSNQYPTRPKSVDAEDLRLGP